MWYEDYVSFETAKLLKEKRFNAECDYFYVNGELVRAQGCACNWNKGETLFTDYKNECSAPTLQLAMKWLREVHNISIEPFVDFGNDNKYWWTVDVAYIKKNGLIDELCGYNSYEEACEAAIKYCLENLI